VDDLKISHVDSKVVYGIISQLEQEFGKEGPLSIHHGKVHDYLGMCLDFSYPGKLVVSMESNIKAMIEETGTSVTPAATHLFNINITIPVYLNESDSDIFVHMVMQLLYLNDLMSARPCHFSVLDYSIRTEMITESLRE
jgi:hypothetical protein